MIEELIEAIRLETISGAIPKPEGYKLVPSEVFDKNPNNERGTIQCDAIASLVEYTKRLANETAVCFASRGQAKVAVVFDWHSDSSNGWGEHVAVMPLQFTEEWAAWSRISGHAIGQRDFAEFIEEHLDCIYKPAAAEILTVATFLEGKRNVTFKSVASLSNGDRSLVWEEKTDAKGVGDAKVPAEITLRIPVYRGAEAETTVELRALFRYRITDGKLTFEVKLMGAEKVADTAFDSIVTALSESLTKAGVTIPVIRGHVSETPRATLNKQIS